MPGGDERKSIAPDEHPKGHLALYYALVLADTGEREKAAQFAVLAAHGTSLLSEEKRLLETLQAQLALK
jgi:hypothetical protein